MVDRVAADREVALAALVVVAGGVARVAVDAHPEFLQQLPGALARERAAREVRLVERPQVLIGTANAVRQEIEGEVEALHGLLKRPCRIHRHLHAVCRHVEQPCLADGILAGRGLATALAGAVVGAALDTADRHFHPGQILETLLVAEPAFARRLDLPAEAVEADAYELGEVRVRVLPLHQAEIVLGLGVVAGSGLPPLAVSDARENIRFHAAVENEESDQVVVGADHDRLRVHVLRETLADPHGFGKFLVEIVVRHRDRLRLDVTGDGLVHQTFNAFGHHVFLVLKTLGRRGPPSAGTGFQGRLLIERAAPAHASSGSGGQGMIFQISLAYSAMVRSEEKRPERATLSSALRSHALGCR